MDLLSRLSCSKLTVEDLFGVEGELAKVINYERVNPTLWKAGIMAKKSFLSVFAKAYDPF